MPQKVFRVGFGMLLILLAVAQTAALSHRQRALVPGGGRWLQRGDAIRALEVIDPPGHPAALPLGEAVVLLVFDPACGHSRAVAHTWSQWIRDSAEAHQVLAISSAPASVASRYLREVGWDAELLLVQPRRLGGLAHALASRTPWVFVLDPGGAIVAEGHGTRLAELTSGLESQE